LVGLVAAVFHTDVLTFAGFRQLSEPDIEQEAQLVRHGLHAGGHHPIYFLSILLFWLIPTMTDLILALVIASGCNFLFGTVP